MKMTKLPQWLDLGDYGISQCQESPNTFGKVYNNLGNTVQVGVRGILLGSTLYLVHITIPNADNRDYRNKSNSNTQRHMKHFHITLRSYPNGMVNYHFHYSVDRKSNGYPRPLTEIWFRGRYDEQLRGRSDCNASILENQARDAMDGYDSEDEKIQEQKVRVWNWRVHQIDMLAKAFLDKVKPPKPEPVEGMDLR